MQIGRKNKDNPSNGQQVDYFPSVSNDDFRTITPDTPAIEQNTPGVVEYLAAILAEMRKPDVAVHTRITQGMVYSNFNYPILANGDRVSLSIYNAGPDTVYLVSNGDQDVSSGMPIPFDGEREIGSKHALWLRCATGKSADVRMIEETA